MQSDWLTDPSRPEKLKCSQLLNASDGADATDRATMHCGSALFKVNGMR